jgi:Sec-independent protein translocase protein TatA
MKREDWIGIFEKLPENMHDQIVLSLSTGIDVYNQRFLQFGDDGLLIRGRLGGTDEGERIFMVPWPEIKMLFFARPIEDDILFRVFGEIIGGVKKSMAAKSKQQEEQEEDDREEEENRPQPMRLPPSSVEAIKEQSTPKPMANMDELKNRLLAQRKPAPNTQTNKPGPGTKMPVK